MISLEAILAAKKTALEEELTAFADCHPQLPQRNFKIALSQSSAGIIAEVKYASPSKGNFGMTQQPATLATSYERGGAAALSVLACQPFFEGSPLFVAQAKQATQLPVLWKDFVFDARQVNMAARMGADALLLIVAVLGERLPKFIRYCQSFELAAVVEVNNLTEAEIAKKAGAEIVLINNRNLRTMEVDLKISQELAHLFSGNELLISASGIQSREDLKLLRRQGFKGFLIGESLARANDPQHKLRELLGNEEN